MPGTLIESLAATCREARLGADLMQVHIAAALSVDQSTIHRFEQGKWPRNPESVIHAYSTETQVPATELWQRALKRWQSDEPPSTLTPSQRAG